MSKLAMIKTTELKKELDARGYDTTSVRPAKRIWSVGFRKSLYQYQDGIEADTREQAIEIARSRLSESWSDYNNGVEVCDCNVDFKYS